MEKQNVQSTIVKQINQPIRRGLLACEFVIFIIKKIKKDMSPRYELNSVYTVCDKQD